MEKTSKMKAALILIAVWMLSCAVMQGAERGFDDIVRAISDRSHTRPLHIPFFGLVNFATFVAHPAGVKHLDLAVFDQLDLDDRGASADGAGQGLDRGLGRLGWLGHADRGPSRVGRPRRHQVSQQQADESGADQDSVGQDSAGQHRKNLYMLRDLP